MTFNFPDFSALDSLKLEVLEEDVLLEFALLSLSYQAQLSEAPPLLDPSHEGEEVGLEHVRAALDDWQQRSQAWWTQQAKPIPKPLSLGVKFSIHCELETRLYNQQSPATREQVEALLNGKGVQVGQVSIKTADNLVRLPGMQVFTDVLEGDEGSSKGFVLHGAAWGLWYESNPSQVAVQLRDHLREAQCTYGLPTDLCQSIIDCETPVLVFSEQRSSLGAMMSNDMRDWQVQLVEQLIAQAQASGSDTLSVAELQAAVRMTPFIRSLQERATRYIGNTREATFPEWLRVIDDSTRETLLQGWSTSDALEHQLEILLGECADLQTFSRHEAKRWLASQLDVQVEPDRLQMIVRYDFSSGDEQLRGEWTCSLLEWLLKGGYSAERLSVEVVDPALRGVLNQANLQRMIRELDVRVRYAPALETRYEQADVRALLERLVDQRMRSALLVARQQGLLATAAQAVQDTMSDRPQAASMQVAQVTIMGYVFSGLLCFFNDEHYVLYAPGAPGSDFLYFNSLRNLSLDLGALTGTAQGRAYLVQRLPFKLRAYFASLFALTAERSDEWPTEQVALRAWKAEDWAEVMARVVDYKVLRILDDLNTVTPKWLLEAPYGLRQRLADLENELRSAQDYMKTVTQPVSFQAFAREQVSRRLNSFPGGPKGWLDPDDLIVSIERTADITFTELVIQGYSASVNFAASARIRSASGQDISGLNVAALGGYVRGAHLGERYIELIKQAYLNDDRAERGRQLEVHRLLLGLKMQRDCLAEALRGELSESQARWLCDVCGKFDEQSLVGDCILSELWLDGCRVEDAYVLQDPRENDGEFLLYLADAPGERSLLTPQALAEAWRKGGWAKYFLQRVDDKSQSRMEELIDRQLRMGDGVAVVLDAIQAGARILDLRNDFHERARRMIENAEERTTSVAQRISGVLVEWCVVLATLLTLPFPPAALGVGLLISTRAFVRAALCWRDGDRSRALQFYLAGVLGLASAAGLGSRVATALGQLWNKLSPGPSSLLMQELKSFVVDVGWPVGSAVGIGVYKGFDEELLWLMENRVQN